MKLDINGVNLLAELEGLKLKAYKCPAGIWTIGLGNTFYADGSKVKEGDVVTKDQAYYLFHLIAAKFEETINNNLKKPITQNQFNSLFCFCYNVGQDAFVKSTLLKLVNINPKDAMIAKEFLKWSKINKVESIGLVNRRMKESALYFTKMLLIALMLTSCGTRKVQKSDKTEDLKQNVEIKVNNDIKKSTDIITNIADSSETTVIEVVDNTKPMVINGISYKNARLRHVKNKISKNTTSKEISVNKGSTEVKKEVKQVKQEAKKAIEKTTNPLIFIGIILVIAFIFIFGKKLV